MTLVRYSVALLLVLTATCRSRADLIVNGSFEDPAVTAGQFLTFGNGSTLITGWTVVGSDVAILSGSFATSSRNPAAHDSTLRTAQARTTSCRLEKRARCIEVT